MSKEHLEYKFVLLKVSVTSCLMVMDWCCCAYGLELFMTQGKVKQMHRAAG